MQKFFKGLWLVIVTWLVLFALFAVVVLIAMFISLITPAGGFVLGIVAQLAVPIIVTVWVVRDAKQFKFKGIDTSPAAWGLGVFLLAAVFLPFYVIRREITWPAKLLQKTGK